MTDDARQWVLERVRAQTEPEVGDVQHVEAPVWTGTQYLKADASKTDTIARQDVETLVDALAAEGELLTWHGLVAPADDDHIRAVIETEARADFSRSLLVARCNSLRNGGGEGE